MTIQQGTTRRPARVALTGVSKAFGRTHALTDVTLAGERGSIHAITGENGAGKSTLMKLLSGVHLPDTGEIRVDGERVRLATPAQARRAGVSTVFQELTILPNLTVAENLCLGREPRRYGALDRRAIVRNAVEVLERGGVALEPKRLCGDLTIAEQQMLEIAKGLVDDAGVFIFDEPTAPLNRAEIDTLEAVLVRLRHVGKLVFYISHRLDEIFRFCDTVSVLKDGRLVATHAAADLSARRLVQLMVGRELTALFPPRRRASCAEPALDVASLSVRAGGPDVSLSVGRGEIVGIAGLEGHGQREILRTLAGIDVPAKSEIRIADRHGAMARHDPARGVQAAVRQGIALMPEDRKSEGLYLGLSVRDNIALGFLRGRPLWRRAHRAPSVVAAWIDRIRLRGLPADAVQSLSGGNQQKVMLARWLAAGVNVLLVEQPTRGVDVGAKAEIYALLRRFAEEGGAVLGVSGDLPELIGMCDRILVVRNGAFVADVRAAEATEEQLLAFALTEPAADRGSRASVNGEEA
ncbi:sugar ABC transporter ATP-binding protein [Burkholderia cepacia]|uniref:Sugar ABC transporter ATP-binding protein n=3 Tax=Burkholderia cepacia TaxID=292 RepID=A0AAX2RA72_BURCE|nr:sugar ABC transporter ATP-binding protein [Burkholderia cepacia]TES67097.1 sugar ABC transporter ATP-binding protein [Burkholderia cepacia]TES98273.1 sugar ABC transporter ATP-binding protein [Burkholderia cepacia]TEU32371.1 sugar ABC transporter ATP-binding protein [Burkholderia cepacia]TEU32498.1 sugar ABC transporter ATP-binding protein [Burkholderia cepacia]TEU64967.1 sugar ABC transporter ATP-binding protein [Burkholderia cepacia]